MPAINLQMGFANHDDIQEKAKQIEAIGDLLSRVEDCPTETAANAGWLVRELAGEIGERLEVE